MLKNKLFNINYFFKIKKGQVNTRPFHLTKPIKLIKPKPMN
jgi:hypothetical protein